MASGLNPMNILQRWKGASSAVVSAIQGASARTGVSFDYLMNKAQQESSFDPKAKASTSSATGLFQFIDSTWLNVVKAYGDQFGIGHLADKISGNGSVSDPVAKKQIMQLREDPEMAANMVAAMTKDNAAYLQSSLGGKVGQNELYMAHFLGLGGADKFLHARQTNAQQAAADLFPAAAGANRSVFYDASGRKKTVEEVYQFFAKKMDPANSGEAVTMIASRGTTKNVSPIMIRAAGEGFVLPDNSGQIEALAGTGGTTNAMSAGERQLLESMLAGIHTFGAGNSSAAGLSNLLSPYTAMVMARLQSPGETGFNAIAPDEKEQRNKNLADTKPEEKHITGIVTG